MEVQTVRELVSVFWTVVNVSLIASFTWFLYQSRNVKDPLAKSAAIALCLIFAGSLASQLYMLLILAFPFSARNEINPFFPIAVIAVVMASTGGVWSIWLFRPRNVPGWVWLILVIGLGAVLAIARALIF